MKKTLILIILCHCFSLCKAVGPKEINFDGSQYLKTNEQAHGGSIAAEYSPQGKNDGSQIIITHVQDKNDPNKLAKNLKSKKGVEVIDIEKLKSDNSDLLVWFVQFDLPHLKVKNSICRIIKNPRQNGSTVFQYVETKKLKSQSEGAPLPDFTRLAENMKKLPIDQYPTTLSQSMTHSTSFKRPHIPWYKRKNAWAGYPRMYD
jgi:hypothetical protein